LAETGTKTFSHQAITVPAPLLTTTTPSGMMTPANDIGRYERMLPGLHGNSPSTRTTTLLLIASAMTLAGCSQLIDPNVPEPIRRFTEPQTRSEYLFYQPSSYDRNRAWPLIVACPSSFPDAPHKQIREWTQLAEQYGFLIAVPDLEFTKRRWRGTPHDLAAILKRNEQRIVSTVRHVRAGHNVSEDRILIYGWKRGATFALYTGMRNPEMFRAIAVTRPDLFDDKLPGRWKAIDHHQPVQIHFGVDDFIKGKHGQTLVEWLRSIGAAITTKTLGDARKADTADAVLFFQKTLRKTPWLQIRAFTPDPMKPLEVHFKTRASLTPKQFRWYFGDGDESVVAQPVHVFAKPGTYNVSLIAAGPRGSRIKRSASVTVPGPQIRPGGQE